MCIYHAMHGSIMWYILFVLWELLVVGNWISKASNENTRLLRLCFFLFAAPPENMYIWSKKFVYYYLKFQNYLREKSS